ncbi:MAG: PAS domain S-box protein, partial [Chloroflexi bacterium]|nr:PAS domain S-box protein [Chloroflexota bacterium]
DITERKQAEEALRESEEAYRNLYSSIRDAILVADTNRNIIGCNVAFTLLFGYTLDEIIGKQTVHVYENEKEFNALGSALKEHYGDSPFLRTVNYKKKTGEVFLGETGVFYLKNDKGEVTGFIGLIRDITERKQAEAELQRAEERYRNLFEDAPVMYVITRNQEGFPVVDDCNGLFLSTLGYNCDQVLGRPLADFYSPQSRAELLPGGGYQRALNGRFLVEERQLMTRDGQVIDTLLHASPESDATGSVCGTRAAYVDISKRKRAEEEILRREEELTALYQASQRFGSTLEVDLVYDALFGSIASLVPCDCLYFSRYNPEAKMIHCLAGWMNGQKLDVSEYPAIPLAPADRGVQSLIIQRGAAMILNDYPRQRSTGLTHHYVSDDGKISPEIRPDEQHPQSCLAVPVKVKNEVAGVIQVFSYQQNAYTQNHLRLVESLSPHAGAAIANAQLYRQAQQEIEQRERAEEEVNRRVRELTLLNRVIAACVAIQAIEPILETICRELAAYFDAPQAAAALFNAEQTEGRVVAEYRSEGCPSGLGEVISLVGNPSIQYLLEHKAPLAIDDAQTDPRLALVHDLMRRRGTVSLLLVPLLVEGEVMGSLGVDAVEAHHFTAEEVDLAHRVAEQVGGALARALLEETQQRLSAAVEQSAEIVIITDTKDTIVYVNPAFERITGYSRAEAVGQTPALLMSGKHDDAFYCELWETISAGRVWQGRFVNRKKDGSLYTEDSTVTPVRNRLGEIVNYVTVKRDVTRELQLEEQFHQAQKMEAVGRLAAGVAHDFNNLLTIIHLSSRLLERKLHPEDPLWPHVKRIQEAGQWAANLTKQLLAFSRREIAEPQVLDLNQVLGELDKMLQRLIGEDIELTTLLADDLWPAKVDPTQVEQVVVNLAVNARDAMPGGGKLTIETANVVLDEEYAAHHLEVEPGEYILLAVSDTGTGMSDDVKAHLFEPFFTTKEKGKGTGLGLATVFGIVKQNKGHVWVYSEPGQGTSFKIYLPCASEGAAKPVQPLPPLAAARGSETVLLVEDETVVRELVRDILAAQGYRVLAARDGVEALQVAGEHEGPIHLLVTDVVMPRLSGKALADQLRSSRPEMRVLYTSGYTDNAIAHHGVLDEGVHFLSKPFELEALARKVRDVLDGSV